MGFDTERRVVFGQDLREEQDFWKRGLTTKAPRVFTEKGLTGVGWFVFEVLNYWEIK